ncbi:hypothetical protein HPB47_011328 [Ixodes persulcatus]|uniref:Uncharacterized protein n=1 Tax=Ixodes persulcatus TaxID=34615 RepID=A0AC60NWP4_IXOPE|nr:hypothetical protein HPB47_011328 [Ixodes persulcatus]
MPNIRNAAPVPFTKLVAGDDANRISAEPTESSKQAVSPAAPRRMSTSKNGQTCQMPEPVEPGARCVKTATNNIYAIVCRDRDDPGLRPEYEYKATEAHSGTLMWEATVRVRWPCDLAFEGRGNSKSEAQRQAASALLEYLEENGHVDCHGSPVTCSESERKALESTRHGPIKVSLPSACVPTMRKLLDEFETVVSNAKPLPDTEDSLEDDLDDDSKDPYGSVAEPMRDIMTGRPLSVTSEEFDFERSKELYCNLEEASSESNSSMNAVRKSLPIYEFREQIVRTVENNRVVVLTGETGSGKTTQVPQFIFEEFIRRDEGAKCNVVVTQPRRISAISMAARIAKERGEELGESVGFQVRLSKQLLRQRGGVLFCTTGILLRHLQGNPTLRGISHVLVDEVHERDVCTDFLLVLLRDVLRVNPTLQVVVMSATVSAEKFSRYFGGAPMLKIPGKIHPVKQYFLDDIRHLQMVPPVVSKANADSVKYVPDVVAHLMRHQPPGAILVFLPGWNEISRVRTALCKRLQPPDWDWVLPLHSRLPFKEQQRIFDTPPPGVRKVILSTNLAETSLTVEDVVYVVDSGLHRDQRYDPLLGVPLLGTFATSRSSARQRLGRAGRVGPGECYHLFTREELEAREEFPRPEMQTTALTKVVMDCKLFCPTTPVGDLLSLAPDPPAPEMIRKAMADLQAMGIMDAEEELTELGHCLVHFGMAPQLAKALVYAAFFGCLGPVLSLAALLSETSNLFTDRESSSKSIRWVKACHDPSMRSDHLALAEIFSRWSQLDSPLEQHRFCQQHSLNIFCLKTAQGLKQEFEKSLTRSLMLTETLKGSGVELFDGKSWCMAPLVSGVLTAALYPQVLRVCKGRLKGRNQLMRNAVDFVCLNSKRSIVSEESLLHRKPPEYEHPWLVYLSAMKPSEHQPTTVYDCTLVTSLHLILFAGLSLDLAEDYVFDAATQSQMATDQACLFIDNQRLLAFRCGREEAELMWRWRRMLDYMMDLHLSLRQIEELNQEEEHLQRNLWPRIVEATAEILARAQASS